MLRLKYVIKSSISIQFECYSGSEPWTILHGIFVFKIVGDVNYITTTLIVWWRWCEQSSNRSTFCFQYDAAESENGTAIQMCSLRLLRNKSVLRCYQHKMNIDALDAMVWQKNPVNKKSWCNVLIGILFIQTDVCELMTLSWHQQAHKNRITLENDTATGTGFRMQVPQYCMYTDTNVVQLNSLRVYWAVMFSEVLWCYVK